MARSLLDLYQRAYSQIRSDQVKYHGNPHTTSVWDVEVAEALQKMVDQEILTRELAGKLARALGRREYGEVGLTKAIVEVCINKFCGFNHPSRQDRRILLDLFHR